MMIDYKKGPMAIVLFLSLFGLLRGTVKLFLKSNPV